MPSELGRDRQARQDLLQRGLLGYVGVVEVAVREASVDPGDVLRTSGLIEAELALDVELVFRVHHAERR